MSHPLREAFLATAYRICLDDLWIETRIGTPNAELAAWMRRRRCARASLVSACNPLGTPHEPWLNQVRDDELRLELADKGWRLWLAEGVSADGGWREPSLFVPGFHGAECRDVMQAFDQLAWVEYDAAGLGQLCWTDEPDFRA